MRDYLTLADALGAVGDPRWERPFRCHHHDDHKASASVNVQKGVYYCYTCHARGTTQGVEYEETLDLRYIEELLAEPNVLSEKIMNIYSTVHPYWLSRFSREACEHFQLGFDPVTGKPCYPIRDAEGQLLGLVLRNNPEDGPKYRYPSGLKIHNMLYNYSQVDSSVVVLVEGAMDVVACWEAGHRAFGIFGSRLSKAQAALIEQLSPDLAVLAFDNDKAGRDCAKQAAELLQCETVAVPWKDWEQYGDDIAELPVDIRKQLLDTLTL